VRDLLKLRPEGREPVAQRAGSWLRRELTHCALPELAGGMESAYRRNGVFLVLGGAGGIGELWTQEMISRYDARVAWVGRRPLDAAIQEKIDRAGRAGTRPKYYSADARDREALRKVCREIKEEWGAIHGVVHAVVGDLDLGLASMDEERFTASISAKSDVCLAIAEVFRSEPLDFVLLFSAMVSFSGDGGKAGYSAGSVFEDAFGFWLRASGWTCKVGIVNWGWWGDDVGVAREVPASFRKRLARMGIVAIDPARAWSSLASLMAGAAQQVAIVSVNDPERTGRGTEPGTPLPQVSDLPERLLPGGTA
jgi:hypothetical protein